MKKYIVLYGDSTQEEYTTFEILREALIHARDIKTYTPRATLVQDYYIHLYSTTSTEVEDMEDWEFVADLNPPTLDGFIEEVTATIYEESTGDIDIVLRSGEVISIPFEDIELYIKGDDFIREGYAYIYSHYRYYYKY